MGKGSTQHQHLVQTEFPPKVLEDWLQIWAERNGLPPVFRVRLRPVAAGSDFLELSVVERCRPNGWATSSSLTFMIGMVIGCCRSVI